MRDEKKSDGSNTRRSGWLIGLLAGARDRLGSSHGVKKITRCGRWRHLAGKQVFCGQVTTVERFGGVVILLDHRAVDGYTCKHAFGARVGEERSLQLPVGAGFCVAAHR